MTDEALHQTNFIYMPLRIVEMTEADCLLATNQLMGFAGGKWRTLQDEIAFVERLPVNSYDEYERKLSRLTQLKQDCHLWEMRSLGLFIITFDWPWGYFQEPIFMVTEKTALSIDNRARNDPKPAPWKTTAREIGEEWMKKQEIKTGKKPSVEKIAQYVEGVLSNRFVTGPRGNLLDWETIKREALTGITGRRKNGG